MKGLLPCSHTRLAVVIGLLAGILILAALILSGHAEAQPTTFVSPMSPQQTTPILSVPYYGAKHLTAYVDHEFPDWGINNRIVIYDGRVARLENGACGWDNQGRAIAYYVQPNGQGECIWYDGHTGNDFNLYYEPVLAAADGTVTTAGWHNWNNRFAGYGLHLRISHSDGYETIYGHLSALAVITNATVSRGQVIGTSGNTGYVFGAPQGGHHLHFEVRLNGQTTDPFGGADANWLWRDGSWDAQGRWVGQPEPTYPISFVVDDGDPGFSKGRGGLGGTSCPPSVCPYWWYTDTVGYNGDMWYTYVNGDSPDYWASWEFLRPGLYELQVWIPSRNATTWSARYWLVSSYLYMPVHETIVDQWGVSNKWVSLGIYSWGPWPQGWWRGVWVSDGTGEAPSTYRHLGIDAIRFRVPWSVYIPMVLKNYP